ncbi:MAG: DUF4276 family protein [Methylicorpusculum sp.]|uniref:DUF4276 family protein n=1 Tax=Methylicorpusculum sp. TaxID=2713644 RepID=UPI002728C9D0|nr:DUF4276 family protein [Methylicorpusculum sp.]MDO8940555.1 DUF4276 family protein [Methylicorpusculum sp.]MDP2204438.1 DUF4276 family protein [Methylicorpusculum sp.]
MKRLGISVEGSTEREFVSRVLGPHLMQLGCSVTAIDIQGNVSLDKIRGVLPRLLGSFDRVTTFYDYYGFKGRGQRSVEELEMAIRETIDPSFSNRLIPYVQKYEFEALLFAVPDKAIEWLQGSANQLNQMQEAVNRCESPESVNDSVETSPSHRMKKLFPGYDKKLHGPEIIELAGLANIRLHCPRFNNWLTQLENLN